MLFIDCQMLLAQNVSLKVMASKDMECSPSILEGLTDIIGMHETGAGDLSFDLEMMVSGAITQNQNPRIFIKRQKNKVFGVRILRNGRLEIITFKIGSPDPSCQGTGSHLQVGQSLNL